MNKVQPCGVHFANTKAIKTKTFNHFSDILKGLSGKNLLLPCTETFIEKINKIDRKSVV